jgi:hypothetical protein
VAVLAAKDDMCAILEEYEKSIRPKASLAEKNMRRRGRGLVGV